METAVQTLTQLPPGTRVVVRYRVDGGTSPEAAGSPSGPSGRPPRPLLTDALGFLVSMDGTSCTVRTRSGDVVVPLADVLAAKAVPPAPKPRSQRPRRE